MKRLLITDNVRPSTVKQLKGINLEPKPWSALNDLSQDDQKKFLNQYDIVVIDLQLNLLSELNRFGTTISNFEQALKSYLIKTNMVVFLISDSQLLAPLSKLFNDDEFIGTIPETDKLPDLSSFLSNIGIPISISETITQFLEPDVVKVDKSKQISEIFRSAIKNTKAVNFKVSGRHNKTLEVYAQANLSPMVFKYTQGLTGAFFLPWDTFIQSPDAILNNVTSILLEDIEFILSYKEDLESVGILINNRWRLTRPRAEDSSHNIISALLQDEGNFVDCSNHLSSDKKTLSDSLKDMGFKGPIRQAFVQISGNKAKIKTKINRLDLTGIGLDAFMAAIYNLKKVDL